MLIVGHVERCSYNYAALLYPTHGAECRYVAWSNWAPAALSTTGFSSPSLYGSIKIRWHPIHSTISLNNKINYCTSYLLSSTKISKIGHVMKKSIYQEKMLQFNTAIHIYNWITIVLDGLLIETSATARNIVLIIFLIFHLPVNSCTKDVRVSDHMFSQSTIKERSFSPLPYIAWPIERSYHYLVAMRNDFEDTEVRHLVVGGTGEQKFLGRVGGVLTAPLSVVLLPNVVQVATWEAFKLPSSVFTQGGYSHLFFFILSAVLLWRCNTPPLAVFLATTAISIFSSSI